MLPILLISVQLTSFVEISKEKGTAEVKRLLRRFGRAGENDERFQDICEDEKTGLLPKSNVTSKGKILSVLLCFGLMVRVQATFFLTVNFTLTYL